MAFRTVAQLEKATNDEKTDINSVLPAEMLFLTFLYLSPQDLLPVQVDDSGREKLLNHISTFSQFIRV